MRPTRRTPPPIPYPTTTLHVLDRAMNPETHDDSMQGDRNYHAFEQQGDQRSDKQMRRALHVGLPADGARQHASVNRKEIEQREHPVLIEQQEAHEDHGAREEMSNIAIERAHRCTLETNNRIVPSRPSMSATPRNSGTRNTRILATAVSNRTRRNANTASLAA